MKIYIAVPSCRDWKASFGASLCGLVRKMTQDGIDFDLCVMQGASVLPRARQLAINIAISNGFTHILFLDDDMCFSPELFNQLITANEDIVAANYARKNPRDPSPMAYGLDGESVSSFGKTGKQEVGWIGFGAVLIRLNAIKNIPMPLFEMAWLDDRKDFIGEDFYFCKKVRDHGGSIFVLHDLKIAHVGDFGYVEQK